MPAASADSFRFPGVLNSQEMLVAEALQSRAWPALAEAIGFGAHEEAHARERLGRIIVRLMASGEPSVSELTARAIVDFAASWTSERNR